MRCEWSDDTGNGSVKSEKDIAKSRCDSMIGVCGFIVLFDLVFLFLALH